MMPLAAFSPTYAIIYEVQIAFVHLRPFIPFPLLANLGPSIVYIAILVRADIVGKWADVGVVQTVEMEQRDEVMGRVNMLGCIFCIISVGFGGSAIS